MNLTELLHLAKGGSVLADVICNILYCNELESLRSLRLCVKIFNAGSPRTLRSAEKENRSNTADVAL